MAIDAIERTVANVDLAENDPQDYVQAYDARMAMHPTRICQDSAEAAALRPRKPMSISANVGKAGPDIPQTKASRDRRAEKSTFRRKVASGAHVSPVRKDKEILAQGIEDDDFTQEPTDSTCKLDLQGPICDVDTAVIYNNSRKEHLEAIVNYCKNKLDGKYFTPSTRQADFVAPEEICDYFQRWLNGKLTSSMIMQVLHLFNFGADVWIACSEDAILTSRTKPRWSKDHARVILPSCHDGHWTLFCVDAISREISHHDSNIGAMTVKRERFQSDMKAHIKKCIHAEYRRASTYSMFNGVGI